MKELKIIFAGLQAAGKTSAIYTLDNDPKKLQNISPTYGVEYSSSRVKILGLEFTRWDLGGQEHLRRDYLENFEDYFSDTNLIFYLIDIQDKESYKEAYGYLKSICNNLLKLENPQPVHFAILLHKFDPDMREKKEWRNQVRNLKISCKSILGKFPHKFFHTSILLPYTVFRAFSMGIRGLYSKSQLIDLKIKKLVEGIHSPLVMLNDQNGFLLGRYVEKDSQIMDAAHFAQTVKFFTISPETLPLREIQTIPLEKTKEIVLALEKIGDVYFMLSAQTISGFIESSDRIKTFFLAILADLAEIFKSWE